MDITHVVYDHEFLKEAVLGENPDENARLNYTAGFLTGLNISKRFMGAKVTTMMPRVWSFLSNTVDPIPSVADFKREIEKETFGAIVLETADFVSIPRRFTREYGIGMANATLLALVQIYRFYHYQNSTNSVQKVLSWIENMEKMYNN